MKKLLLSILSLVVSVVFASAQDQTAKFDFTTEDYGLTRCSSNSDPYLESGSKVEIEPVTLTLFKDEGSNGMRLWTTEMRFFKNSNAGFTASVPAGYVIKEIALNTTSSFGLAAGEAGEFSSNRWTGEAQSVKINFLGTATGKLSSVTVTYAKAAAGGDVELVDGDGSEEHPYLVSQLADLPTVKDAWVMGYVVGYNTGDFFAPNAVFAAEGAPSKRVLLAATPDANAIAGCLDIMSIRSDADATSQTLSLDVHPELLGAVVAVKCGAVEKTFLNDYFTTQLVQQVVFKSAAPEVPVYTVTIENPVGGVVRVLNGQTEIFTGATVEEGSRLSFIADTENGYEFKSFLVNGVATTEATYIVNSDVTVSAEFTSLNVPDPAVPNRAIVKTMPSSYYNNVDHRVLIPWVATGNSPLRDESGEGVGANESESFTVAMWFNPTAVITSDTKLGNIMSMGTNNHLQQGGAWYFCIDANGALTIKGSEAGDNHNAPGINGTAIDGTCALNEMHFLLFSVDNTNLKATVYLDGAKVLDKSLNAAIAYKWGDGHFHFASYGVSMILDEVQFYNAALTDAEAALAYANKPREISSVKSIYTFDEVIEGTTSQYANTVAGGPDVVAVFEKYTGSAYWGGNGLVDTGAGHTQVEAEPTYVDGRDTSVVDPVEYYTLTVNANGCEYQLVGCDDLTAIPAGTEMSLGIVSVPEGKLLEAVKLNDEVLEGESTYEFVINENSTLEIVLKDAPVLYTLNIIQNEGGLLEVLDGETKLENGAKVAEGTMLTLVATAEEGYEFKGFSYNGNPLEGDMVVVEEDFTVAAEFTVVETPGVTYTAPGGTTKPDNYLAAITTEGADANLDLSYDAHPGIYNVIEGITVTPGNEFTLNLVAKSLGEGSNYTKREDLRYDVAYIFTDWYGTGNFELLTSYGKVPPTHNVYGNYDYVMNIAQALTMPADVEGGTAARIRVIYANAWTVPGTSDKSQGQEADPNSKFIDGGIAYDFVVMAAAAAPEVVGKSVIVPAGTSAKPYTFRFDDAVLGSHVNGGNNETTDLRSRNFTYSAWINIKDAASGVVMGNIQKAFSNATGAFRVTYSNGKLNLNGRDALTIRSFKDVNGSESTDAGTALDEWVYISVVADQDAQTVTLYKNCQPVSSYATTYGVGLIEDEAVFFIADQGANILFSDVQLWTKALTQAELEETMYANYAQAPEGLAAYYQATEMEEGSTTNLRNLGTEAVTPGQVITGNYQLIGGWNPQFSGLTATDIQVSDEYHPAKGGETVEYYTLTVNANGCEYQLVGCDDLTAIPAGTEMVLGIVSVPEGKLLEAVKLNDEVLEGESTYEFVINENSTLEIVLKDAPVLYTLNIIQNEGGLLEVLDGETKLENGAKVAEGTMLTLVATAEEGYEFKSFSYNGNPLEGDMVVVEEDFTVAAEFTKIQAPGQSVVVPAGTSAKPYTFRFDDAVLGSHVNGGNNETTDLRSRNFTYSAWINIKDAASGVVMGNIQKAFSNATGAFRVTYSNGKLNLNGRDALTIRSFKDVNGSESTDAGTALDEWVYISVVADQDAQTVTLYKNCQPVSSYATTYGVGLLEDEAVFFIADQGANILFSDVQLWTKALTQDELIETFYADYAQAPEGLVAYYKAGEMEEGSTTNLRNLGTEAVTPGQVITGNYQLIGGWNPQFSGLTATDIQVSDEYHANPVVVDVTVNQPAGEGNSIKVLGKNGREIDGTANIFEELTVEADLAENYDLISIDVTDAAGNTVNYTPEEMPFTVYGDVTVGVTVKNNSICHITVINPIESDGYRGEVRNNRNVPFEYDEAEGLDVEKGTSIYFIVIPPAQEGLYTLKSVKHNDTDITENLTEVGDELFYIVGPVNEDHTFEVAHDRQVGLISINEDGDNVLSFEDGVLNVAEEGAVIEVVDMNGRIVARGEGAVLPVRDLVQGVYVARATTASGVHTLKFIKL